MSCSYLLCEPLNLKFPLGEHVSINSSRAYNANSVGHQKNLMKQYISLYDKMKLYVIEMELL